MEKCQTLSIATYCHVADKVPGAFLVQTNLQYVTQCLTQFGVSTGQRPPPVSDVNAATLFILSEGSNFSCMEEICATLAGVFQCGYRFLLLPIGYNDF